MSLGDVEVFRTSTAEPTKEGIDWTYLKDMTQYDVLWRNDQDVIFDLGNLVNDKYTASFKTTLTLMFWERDEPVNTADLILPIPAKDGVPPMLDTLSTSGSRAVARQTLPEATEHAIVSIAACGQIGEEFWYSNVLSSLTETFADTTGPLGGASPFREIQLFIDGILAGIVWPFPVVFTGGLAPGLWRPVVGIDAFDLRESEIDITPFVPMLSGRSHLFELKVLGLSDRLDGNMSLTEAIGDYWVVTGKIFVFLGDRNGRIDHKAPITTEDTRDFSASSNLNAGASSLVAVNERLEYSVTAHRKLVISSHNGEWLQELTFRNHGRVTDFGYTQNNSQLSTGYSQATYQDGTTRIRELNYPLEVETTFRIFPDEGFSIDASIEYAQILGSHASPETSHAWSNEQNSQPTLSPGLKQSNAANSTTHARVSGTASFTSLTNTSISFGTTNEVFIATQNDTLGYTRMVEAVNGSVQLDWSESTPSMKTTPQPSKGLVQLNELLDYGRWSVKALIGRGPL